MNRSGHVMLDLETLSTDQKCVAISIGAVMFNKESITHEFYRVLSIDDQLMKNREIDPGTIIWWMKQSDAARKVFQEIKSGQTKQALLDFVDWFTHNSEKASIWSNGANFDIPIMRSLLKDFEIPIPWKYWDEKCFRTLKPLIPKTNEVNMVKHNALWDARFQAQQLQKISHVL